MTGGLLQLMSYGAEDTYLTGNPDISFFKIVYRRHVNFAVQQIEQPLKGTIDFGNKVTCKIAKKGDLISNMYLVLDLDNSGTVDISSIVLDEHIDMDIVKPIEGMSFQNISFNSSSIEGDIQSENDFEWYAVKLLTFKNSKSQFSVFDYNERIEDLDNLMTGEDLSVEEYNAKKKKHIVRFINKFYELQDSYPVDTYLGSKIDDDNNLVLTNKVSLKDEKFAGQKNKFMAAFLDTYIELNGMMFSAAHNLNVWIHQQIWTEGVLGAVPAYMIWTKRTLDNKSIYNGIIKVEEPIPDGFNGPTEDMFEYEI
jgi:hypothetical protein